MNPEVATGGQSGTGGIRGSGGSRPPVTMGTGGTSETVIGTGGTVGTDAASSTDLRVDRGTGGMVDGGGGGNAPDAPTTVVGYTLSGVATYRGDAAGAYTILFNSVCEASFGGSLKEGASELTARGLRGGFALITRSCDGGNHWATLKTMVGNGHELLNQSMSQPCLTTNNALAGNCPAGSPRSNNYMAEIDGANGVIRDKTGFTPAVFSFPYDVCDPAAITYLKGKPFLGSRCGPGRSNGTDFSDPYTFKSDFWGPALSMYKDTACQGLAANAQPNQASATCRTHVLNAPLDEAITKKVWVVRGFHGFATDTGTYQPVAVADYRAHLDVVAEKAKSGQLWVAGPSEILRYRFARQFCIAPTLTGNKLTFGAPNANCMKYATALTYIVKAADGADPAELSITQGGQKVAAKKTGAGTFLVEADPSKGDATLD